MTPKYRIVFFDVDSTLVTIEGIDVLGGGAPEIVRLTNAAMNGEIPLEEAYQQRLDAIRPTARAVERLGALYVESLVTGAAETVRTLKKAGCLVHLVTAGIEQAIMPLAGRLGVEARAVHAVKLHFDASGGYEGYDRRSHLTRQRGKELVVRDVRARTHGKAVFIGDGTSDLETKPAVDLFVGFGGVHTRSRVQENADVFIDSSDLRAILPHLLDGDGGRVV